MFARQSRLAAVAAGTTFAVLAAMGLPAHAAADHPVKRPKPVAGKNAGAAGIKTFAQQEAVARISPYGAVAPGEYTEALASLRGLPSNGSRWTEVTNQRYDADDPRYRDPVFSNSGGGAGLVAGRVTGLAAGNGWLFGAGANGGVFRQRQGTDGWTPISDSLLALSTGDLVYDAKADTLWYATGEANTGATSLHRRRRLPAPERIARPRLHRRRPRRRQRTGEHAASTSSSSTARATSTPPPTVGCGGTPSTRAGSRKRGSGSSCPTRPPSRTSRSRTTTSSTTSWSSRAPAAASCWPTRLGARVPPTTASTSPPTAARPGSFSRINAERRHRQRRRRQRGVRGLRRRQAVLPGAGEPDGAPRRFRHAHCRASSRPASASPDRGRKIADSDKLKNCGSALQTSDYLPGVQAWYNNFIEVDPGNARHVYLGLEEVYETEDGGATWKTVGPYWNFGFPCFDASEPDGGCPRTTHADQHSVAIDDGTRLRRQRRRRLLPPARPDGQPGERGRPRHRLAEPQREPAHAAVLLGRHRPGPERPGPPRRRRASGQRRLAAAGRRTQAGQPVRWRRRRHHRQPAQRVPDPRRVRVPGALADQELRPQRRHHQRDLRHHRARCERPLHRAVHRRPRLEEHRRRHERALGRRRQLVLAPRLRLQLHRRPGRGRGGQRAGSRRTRWTPPVPD